VLLLSRAFGCSPIRRFAERLSPWYGASGRKKSPGRPGCRRDVQPSGELRAAVNHRAANHGTLSCVGFVAGSVIDAQISGAGEVETHGRQIENFGSHLIAIFRT
jgi:hypothetical protein